MRRRLLPACLALLVLTGLVLVLPVLSSPGASPVPVKALADEVPMTAAPAPAPGTTVGQEITGVRPGTPTARPGTPAAKPGTPAARPAATTAPVLTVTRTHVHPFSMVGVTWVLDPGVKDTVVQVRVQNAQGAWGHWTQIGAEDAVPNPNALTGKKERGGTAPLWTGPSTGVQAELTTRSGARPVDVKLDLIDPGASAADTALGQPAIRDTAHAASSMPPVYSRAQWGADESIRTWDPQYASTIKAATIHHSADSNDYTADQVPALMRAIYRYHAVSLGWGDIGYNVIVDKFGRMWEGRYGGLASTVIGAHAGGFNTYTFGVSMLGNYDLVDVPPAVISSVSSIISWKFSLYGVNPLGRTTLISGGGGTDKYAPGVPVNLPTIFAHRDVGATVCPGRYGYARMDQIRNLVAGTVVDLTQISQRYNSDSALRTLLGAQQTAPDLTSDRSGGYATYDNGALYYSAATGVKMVQGPIRDLWSASGAQAGILRFPTTDVGPTTDGTGQYARFQGGAIYSTPATGTRAVLGPIQDLWNATGAETGVLGYPTWSVSNLPGGGQYGTFEHGSIYWTSSTGARVLLGPIETLWKANGAQNGVLGFPTQSVSTAADGQGQYARFQGGSVYWSQATGARALFGPIETLWKANGAEQGALGYPTQSVTPLPDGGQFATFQNGSIFWSQPTGAHAMSGAIGTSWTAAGAQAGFLGYPTSDILTTADGQGRYARFQRGSMYWSPSTGAHHVVGAIGALWSAVGAEHGLLGYPTSDEQGTGDGVGRVSRFEHGSIYWTPATGARAMLGAVETAWDAAGAEQGFLGYPVQSVSWAADHVGQYARFQRGVIFWSPSSGAHQVLGAIGALWAAGGAEHGLLGYPVSDELGTPDGVGRVSRFQHGSIYWTPTTGARAMLGAIETRWLADGAQAGPMGYPTQSVSNLPGGGQYARFEHGSIYWTTSTGAWEVRDPFLAAWVAVGAEHGALGYPIGEPYAVNGGQWQKFQHGYVAYSTALRRAWAVHQ